MQETPDDGALSFSNFSTSILYPNSLQAESEDMLLQPLSVSVWFSGAVPRHLAHSNIPIKISVALDEEYQLFTVPVIEVESCYSRESFHFNNCVASSQYEPCSMSGSESGDASITFLPLPSTFDHMDPDHWVRLSGTIQSWLLTLMDTVTPEWTWGRDAFWYAFVAANPDFPNGKWAFWDPSIPLEGQFIEEWVECGTNLSIEGADEELTAPLTDNDTRDFIWREFSRHIALFYPYPLISTT
ncbi:hypothetical protein BD769DRAFT_1660325 [Suillus cothurnatus]|nr:hypothetical protein BD769DRAFT_1660325 [Suillus cothurnatus]